MSRNKFFGVGATLVAGVLALVLVRAQGIISAGPDVDFNAGDDRIEIAKQLRGAAKEESPEDKQLKQLPRPPQAQELQPTPKSKRLESCMMRHACKAKLEAAQKGQKRNPLPAATQESPEDKFLKQLPPPPTHGKPGRSSKSDLMPDRVASLFSGLNPFEPGKAHAQAAYSARVDPTNRYYNPSPNHAFMNVIGGFLYANNPTPLISPYYPSTQYPYTEQKPYAMIGFTIPSTGWYIINVNTGRGTAKLRHLYNGPIIDEWNFSSSTSYYNDYATMEYLSAGYHYVYFWFTGGVGYLAHASVESYP